MTILTRSKSVLGSITDARLKGINGILASGQAPAYNQGLKAFMPRAHEAFGLKNLWQVFGMGGDVDTDRPGVDFQAKNLGASIRHEGLDPDIQAHMLTLKKRLMQAMLVAQVANLKSHGLNHIQIKDTMFFKHHVEPVLKAYDLTDMSNFVPTVNFGFWFEELDMPQVLMTLLPNFQMKSKIQEAPGFSDSHMGYLESDSFTARYRTQDKFTVTAQGFSAHTDVTEDLQQDADPAAFGKILLSLAHGVNKAFETCLVNGDDTDSGGGAGSGHQDSDVQGVTNDARKGFKGLRKKALANSANAGHDAGGGGFGKTVWDETMSKLGRFGHEPSDIVSIVGISHGYKLKQGAIPEVLALNTYGAEATLLTGKLPPLYGVLPYVSQAVREDVNSSGVYAASQTKTTILMLNKTRCAVGIRQPMRLWAAPALPNADKILCTAKMRAGFNAVTQGSDETSIAIAYNVAK